MDIVKLHWRTERQGNACHVFQQKIKQIKIALTKWNRDTFGDIFKQLTIREEVAKLKEGLFEEEPTEENRMVLQKAQTKYKKYLHYEEEFWKQKVGGT